MALRISDEDYKKGANLDSGYDPNRGQADYNEKFNDLNKAEKAGNADGNIANKDLGAEKSNSDNLKSAEESPGGNWTNNFSGKNGGNQGGKGKGKTNGKFGFLKKKGPLTTIILTVVGGGIGIGGLLSPALLIVNLKEVMVNKFNTQLTSMDIRTTKMLRSKATSDIGLCAGVINIRCKYASMSDRQLKNFEKAGIKVHYGEATVTTTIETTNPDGTKHTTTTTETKSVGKGLTNSEVSDIKGNVKTTITTTDVKYNKSIVGRAKPTGWEFDGKIVSPENLTKELNTNTKFRSAVKKGYNPLFAGFSDKIWKSVSSKLGISKKAVVIDGVTDEEKLKNTQEKTKYGSISEDAGSTTHLTDKDTKPNGDPYTADEINNHNAAIDAAKESGSEILKGAKETATTGKKWGVKIAESAGGKIAGKAIGVLGAVDIACSMYSAVKLVGLAAKTVRAVQLARYAILFLSVADQIKSGNSPRPEDVSYLGKILTTEFVSTMALNAALEPIKISPQGKTATDSFGYKYAAYGEVGKMETVSTMFLAGGGVTGALINIPSMINQYLKGSPQATCGTVKNPFVAGASTIGGIALFLIPGVNIAQAAKAFGQGLLAAAAMYVLAQLPNLLKDIIAGVIVDETTVGEAAGEAITSGSSVIMSKAAASGGNSPLTPADAVAYNNLSKDIIAQYSEEDRLAHSPLDINNSNTFLGSIVSGLIPYINRMSSFSGTLSSIASLTTNSLSLLSPITKAADQSEYTMCQDLDINDPNGDGDPSDRIATDPYCNIQYGIPTADLEADPIEVLNQMTGEIDQMTGEPIVGSKYEAFLTNCINRNPDMPIGNTGENFQGDSGASCVIGSKDNLDVNTGYPKAKYYYVYYIDQRVQNGMDGTDETLNAAMDNGMDADIAFYDDTLDNYNIASNQLDNIYASAITSDINIVSSEAIETPSSLPTTKQMNNNLQSIITNAQNTNICNSTSINNRTTDFSYLCMQPYFNKEYIGI